MATTKQTSIQIARVEVTIAGLSSLLSNNKNPEWIENGKPKGVTRDEEFHSTLHVREDGRFGFPSAAVKKALVQSATWNTGGKKLTKVSLMGAIQVVGDYILPVEDSEPRPFIHVVRNPNTGGCFTAVRAEFPTPWRIRVPLVYYSSLFTDDKILNLFQIAGFSVGIGAWRTEKGGPMGQFQPVEIRHLGGEA